MNASKGFLAILVSALCVLGAARVARAAGRLPPIERVEILPQRAIAVNGAPFLPRMAWLLDPGKLPAAKECGMNVVAGYWPGSGGTKDVKEYLDRVQEAGLYGVMPFDERLRGHPALLGYIHDDEPDLPHPESDAAVEPGEGLRLNSKTPLWKLVDGDTSSWSVLDPMEGASVTIRLKEPVTASRLAVWLTISPGLSVAKEIAFEADGREVLRARLEAKKGRQAFDLPEAVELRELTLKVTRAAPGENVWGSIGEVEALNAAGENVILSPPRPVPRARPEEILKRYRDFKRHDPDRPVFLTLTGYFHPQFKKWGEEHKTLYPEYVRACDVVGYDIYPIYGWNKPEWIHLVHEATELLVRMAGPRPVYAWIETSKGGQWTGPLERQKDVTPRHIRAEVWMALCRGATAIGYFTHVWKPSYDPFGVPPRNREALASVNAQLDRLAPVLLGGETPGRVSIEAEGSVKLDALARRKGEDLYVFAVNYDERDVPARATIRVEGLAAGRTVEVVDEDRSIAASGGCFVDDLEPLDVHVYRIRDAFSGE